MAQYLTIKEVAKMLRVTPLTLRNWDKQGKLKAYRNPINNYRVYKADKIEAFVKLIERDRLPVKKSTNNKSKI